MANLFNDIGAINPGFTDFIEDRDSIDYLKDVRTQLRETMLKNYEPNKLDGQTEFDAICLKHLNNLNTSNGDNIIRIKARIPVLHNMIPVPKNETDFLAMSLYPTFIGVTKDFNPAPTPGSVIPGTRMMVTFDNMRNFAGPHIKSIFDITNVTAAGGGGGSPGTPLPPVRLKSKGPLARYGDNTPYGYFSISYGTKLGMVKSDPRTAHKSRKDSIRFVGFRRSGRMTPRGITLHEGAVRGGVDNTVRTLQSKGLGTHYIIKKDGTILEVNEPTTIVSHTKAGGYNSKFVGIDFNGGDPRAGKNSWKQVSKILTIDSERPKDACEAAWQLLNHLAKKFSFNIDSTYNYNSKAKTVTVPLGKLSTSIAIKGSIHSHAEIQAGRVDGDFVKLYMINRLFGKSSKQAYSGAKAQWLHAGSGPGRKATISGVTSPPKKTPTGPVVWPNGEPKKTIPVGFLGRTSGLRAVQGIAGAIAEFNNYSGEQYTEAQLKTVIDAEKVPPNKQPDLNGIQ